MEGYLFRKYKSWVTGGFVLKWKDLLNGEVLN